LNDVSRLTTEIAHVLFVDLVGYSRMPMEDQARIVRSLQAALQGTDEFRRAESSGELICLPTGDGAALVFFRDPLSPVHCALQIAETLVDQPDVILRMGVHSGPVSRSVDISGRENVSGSGINIAQRVMDCGDAGHILVSGSSADMILEFDGWQEKLKSLGECTVKHDRPIRIFRLCSDGLGNPLMPSKLSANAATQARTASQATASRSTKIAIIYKRNIPADEHVLEVLELYLRQNGLTVFVDRHMSIGVEWALEIDQQIKSSDAVIPLISAASVNSEMLEHEIQTAHRAAQSQNGRPRLLPVRVDYDGLLPEGIGYILNPLQYAYWSGEEDDARLAKDMLHTVQGPPVPEAMVTSNRVESGGGVVPLDSSYYIPRPADKDFADSMSRGDSIVLVKGARQMGKTSLLARGLQHARTLGARVVTTDLQVLDENQLTTDTALYLALATSIASQLDLPESPKKRWDPDLGANMNLEYFIRKQVLGSFTERLVWGLDEVDRLFACDFGSQVFGLFRSWHNRRSLDPFGPWTRLTLAIAYATEAHLFISDLNQSPFNVGTRLELDDFTVEQVAELNCRYNNPMKTDDEIRRLHILLGGQPYLTRRALDEMTSHSLSLDEIAANADRETGLFGDHLRRLLVSLSRDPALAAEFMVVVKDGRCATQEGFYRLRSGGLVNGEIPSEARPRCKLYETYLSRHLSAN